MTFALNMIGACPYFLKLAMSPQALSQETRDSRIAVVYDGMWENVCDEFAQDRFEKVIFIKASDRMPSPKRQLLNVMASLNPKSCKVPKNGKYYSVKQALKQADSYQDEVRAAFVPERFAFITSSSGTTVGGIVKGTVATNESTIAQMYLGEASNVQYFPHDRCLNNLPPTASTSLNVMFFMPLFFGETIIIDPRVSEDVFYKQLTVLKPNIALTTGSYWETFFNRVEKELKTGKKFDFSCAKEWVLGGEGTDVRKYKKWDEIVKQSGGKGIFSGYGSSELFSATSVETLEARYDFSKSIMSVGIPYAGIVMGVFDEVGNELEYNRRGELRIKSRSAMKEYYNQPELTAQTVVDGWVHTGDLGEIDENGFVYIWGRIKDTVTDSEGNTVYLFDIANKIKEKSFIDDTIVLPICKNEDGSLAAHIVWEGEPSKEEQMHYLEELNKSLKEYLPRSLSVVAYSIHEGMLPYSPTTLKKDKNKLSKQTSGYVQVVDGQMHYTEI